MPVTSTIPPRDGTATPARTVRRLTGLKPTGHLQLGNLIGAIAPMVAAQDDPEAVPVVMVADLHALTVDHRPHEVRGLTLEQATTLLAAGLDPERASLFVQSHVPEHTEMHYLLESVTGYGEAQRMIQFKEKAGRRPGGPARTRLSLLTYPVLMAADILLHDTDEVPVGEDQSQHLELARTLAARFNARYGDTFTVPRQAAPPVGRRIMDLADPTRKMAKTAADGAGILRLLDPPDELSRKIKRAVTDADGEVRYDPVAKPGVSNLLTILAACGPGGEPDRLAAGFTSYRQLKAATAEVVIDTLVALQRRYRELVADRAYVREVLAIGADRARQRGAVTVARARRALGLLPTLTHEPG